MKRCAFILLLLSQLSPALAQDAGTPLNVYYGEIPEGENTYFVAPEGNDASAGTEAEPWATLTHAVTQVRRGDVIVMRGGVYHHDATISIQSPSGYFDELIVVTAYPGEVPVLDFSSQPKVRNVHGIRLNANWWHLIGITVRNASHNGIRMDGSYNILEQVTAYGNHDSGIHMAGGASHNLIKNCDSFHNFNYDLSRTPRIGNNADGFSAKFEIGPGNRYVGVRAWENSDDGFDFWEAASTIVVENSWAFGNGDAAVFGNPANFEGNGNGFKLGGNYVVADHVVVRSMAFDNFGSSGNAKGFDYNNNRGAMTLVHNTAYNNGRNYVFPLDPPGGQAVFLNNLSAMPANLHAQTPPSAVLAGNSWQQTTEVTADLFLSLDTERARDPRERDGSLPDIDLLKPAPGTFIVDGGVVLDAPFYGAAPDIGAYELQSGAPVDPAVPRGSGSLIAELTVFDMEHASGWNVRTGLQTGDAPFGDADATIVSVDAPVVVNEWIQTAAASRAKHYLLSTATFSLNEPAQVFIAHSDEIAEKPAWLSEYFETAAALTIAEPGAGERRMTLYEREVQPGEVVTLGRNSTDGTTEAPMYVVLVGRMVTPSVEDAPRPVVATALDGVYPNPVGGAATVSFTLAGAADVAVEVYDALGRQVARVNGGYHAAGAHTVSWDARGLPAGVYYLRLAADGFSAARKVVKLRD